MHRRLLALGSIVGLILSAACSSSQQVDGDDQEGESKTQRSTRSDELETAAATAAPPDPGALVRVTISSKVGVNLNEIPTSVRDRVAAQILAEPNSFWKARASRQIEHTNYRLIYRNFFYNPPRKMMPITRPEEWDISLTSQPTRRTFQGHDVIMLNYSMTTTILTDVNSPKDAEPKLKAAGGVWDEPFSLPLDPEFLLQRTGTACVDEDAFPLGTADSENVASLFDDQCEVETEETASCHLTPPLPTESCVDALTNHVGRVDTNLHFERLPWNSNLANQVRRKPPANNAGPDLIPRGDGLEENRVIYRYIPADSCAIAEGCVSGSGWRRLLQFTASIENRGNTPLRAGTTEDGSPLREHNVFEFSQCHQHFHFSHYGDFKFGQLPGDKRAFCVESTARWSNAETSPLTHEFSCTNQGIATGWGDDYQAGVECQWIDITSLPKKSNTLPLSFQINPDKFLCEGAPVVDRHGNPTFEPTDFTTETGLPVDRPLCTFAPGTLNNNFVSLDVTVPAKGGFVTAPCTRDQSGPLRNCGFKEQELRSCTPGRRVSLNCHVRSSDPRQVVRVCEASHLLGGTACTHKDALDSANGRDFTLNFNCPSARDIHEPGGKYAIYSAGLVNGDAAADVTCD